VVVLDKPIACLDARVRWSSAVQASARASGTSIRPSGGSDALGEAPRLSLRHGRPKRTVHGLLGENEPTIPRRVVEHELRPAAERCGAVARFTADRAVPANIGDQGEASGAYTWARRRT